MNNKIKIILLKLVFFTLLIYLKVNSQVIDTVFTPFQIDSTEINQIEKEYGLNIDTGIEFRNPPDISSKYSISDSMIKYKYYQDLKELLYLFPGIFIYELGAFGYNHGVMVDFFDSRAFEITQNSITTNDPLGGNLYINNYAIEDINKIEYLSGTKAFLYGFNSNSGIINIKNQNYNFSKSYTKIRYSETTYEETSLDGIFSQNIYSNLNLKLGIRRNASDGRYTNSEYDSWNLRFKTNYKLLNKYDTYLSVNYNQNKVGMNGGVDLETTDINDAYDRLKATIRLERAYQKISRNDIEFGLMGNPFNNPENLTTLLLYFTNQFYYFKNYIPNSKYLSESIKNHTRWMGIKIIQDMFFTDFIFKPELHFGAEIRTYQILQSPLMNYKKQTQKRVFSDIILFPASFLKVNTFSKFMNINNINTVDAGIITTFVVNKFINIDLGYSHSHRFPYELEQWSSEIQSSKLPIEKHNIKEIILNFTPFNILNLSINYSNYQIKDAIIIYQKYQPEKNKPYFVFSPLLKTDQELINTTLKINLWKIESITNLSLNLKDKFEKHLYIHPRYFLYTEAFYNDNLFNDKLLTKLGFRFRFYSKQSSRYYDPGYDFYLPNTGYILGDFIYLDAILFFKIGNAIVNFVVENILDTRCSITYFYPLKDRSLRIGINWVFED